MTAKKMLHSRAQRTRRLAPPKNRVATGGAAACFRPKAQSISAAVGAGTKSPAAKAAGKSCCRWGGWYVLYIRTPGGAKPPADPPHASTRVHAWERCIVGSGACLESCTARGRAMVGIAKDSWSTNRFQDTQKDPARKRAGPSLFPLPTEQQNPARKRARFCCTANLLDGEDTLLLVAASLGGGVVVGIVITCRSVMQMRPLLRVPKNAK